jgi:hypothetical protein
VAEVVASLMGVDLVKLTEQVFANTRKCLNIKKEIQDREDKEDQARSYIEDDHSDETDAEDLNDPDPMNPED